LSGPGDPAAPIPSEPTPPLPGRPVPTVFFASDYGLHDEFVGVVHAVLQRRVPGLRVVDLVHDLAPFDVRMAAFLLARAVVHLGPGTVLAVVDPGVGGPRRGVALSVAGAGPSWFVGPDNGLLVAAAERAGGIAAAFELTPPHRAGSAGPVSFDGRDLFAPVVAALCGGTPVERLGGRIDPASLIRVAPPVDERRGSPDGGTRLRAEVLWVDRFGNLKLASSAEAAGEGAAPLGRRVEGRVERGSPGTFDLRRVRAFDDLTGDELGLMADADGHLAVVGRQRSAAAALGIDVGDIIELSW
jgi:hypothetical protein